MTDLATKLVIVRHGQTTANSQGLLNGWTDVPLDEIGQRQAQLVAHRISLEIEAHALISSPLARARSTAGAISELTGLEIEERPDLREMHFGDLEGLPVDRLRLDHPEIAMQAFDPHNLSLQWPNGDHIAEFYERILSTFASIAEEHASKTVVVVAHGGVIGSYLRSIAGEPLNAWQALSVRNCALSVVTVSRDSSEIISRNDCAHLDAVLAMVEETRRS